MKGPKQKIVIKFQGGKIEVDLAKEFKITREKITDHLLRQPSKYGYFLAARARLQKVVNDLELKGNEMYGRAYQKAKQSKSSGRGLSNEDARTEADLNKDYLLTMRDLNVAKENLQLLDGCVKAFEQRASILQTLSANQRAERE